MKGLENGVFREIKDKISHFLIYPLVVAGNFSPGLRVKFCLKKDPFLSHLFFTSDKLRFLGSLPFL